MSNVNIPINCDKISYNTDIDPHIAKETTDFMLNCYVEEAGNYGVLTNMKGNRRIPITLPEGVNEFIKTTIDTDSRSLILFLYNSNNNHCIFRVNADSYKVERVIWSNPILNFSLDYPVVKADCVGDYVFWVDGHTENKHLHVEKAINFTNAPTYNCRIKGTNFRTDTPNKLSVDDVVYINIDNSGYTGYHKVETIIDDYTFSVYGQTAITGTLIGTATIYIDSYSTITEDTINVIQKPPVLRPVINLYSDNTKNINHIRGKMFQFAYRYVNLDNTISRFSPISAIPLGAYEEDGLGDFTSTVYFQNCIKIDYPVRDFEVKRCEFAFRVGNDGQWYILKRKTVNLLSDTIYFYNDEAYDAIENAEVLTGYDDVPIYSQTQSFVDGRYLAYLQNKKGYNTVDIDVSLTPKYIYQNYQVSHGSILATLPTAINVRGERDDSVYVNQGSKKYANFSFDFSSSVGDMPPRPTIRTAIKTSTYSGGFTAGQFVRIAIKRRSDNAEMKSQYFYVAASVIGTTNINNYLYQCFQYFNKYGSFFTTAKVIPYGYYTYNKNSNKPYWWYDRYNRSILTIDPGRYTGELPAGFTSSDCEFQSAFITGNDIFGNTQSYKNLADANEYAKHYATNNPAYPVSTNSITYATYTPTQLNAWKDCYYPVIEIYDKSTVLSTYKFPSFKMAATHPFAIVYMDKNKRRCGACVSTESSVYVKSEAEQQTNNEYCAQIQWQINNEAPDWAYYFQWYYAGNTRTKNWTQCVCKYINNPADTIYTEISLQWLTQYKTEHPLSKVSTYTWTKGDRVRLIGQEPFLDSTKSPAWVPAFTQQYDFEILGQDELTGNIRISRIATLPGDPNNPGQDWHAQKPSDLKLPDYWAHLTNHSGYDTYTNGVDTYEKLPSKQDNGDPIQNYFYTWINNTSGGYRSGTIFVYVNGWISTEYNKNFNTTYLYGTLIEIYTPNSNSDTTVYYEFSDIYPINKINGHNYHSGDYQNQDNLKSAIGIFQSGDAYFMSSNIYPLNGWVPFVVERPYYSEWYDSQAWNKGRPSIAVERSITNEFSTIQLSRPYTPNSNVNGLCTFDYEEEVYSIPPDNGKIFQCTYLGDVLKIYQRNKSTTIYIGKYQTMNTDGSSNLIMAEKVLGSKNVSKESYGTIYPNSVCNGHGRAYFFDIDHGDVMQDSQGGIVPLGIKYGIKKKMIELSARIRKDGEKSWDIISAYDFRNDILYITFLKLATKEGITLAYYEQKQEWRGEYSFTPSQWTRFGDKVFSCKDGALWEHNVDSVPRCNFFGKQYPFSISYYVNDNPHLEKKFLNMSIDGNMPVDVDIKTHSDVSYRTGMQTKIPKRLFVKKEGLFHTSILNNIIQNGGIKITGIYNGSVMTGKGATITLSDSSGQKVELKSIQVGVNM